MPRNAPNTTQEKLQRLSLLQAATQQAQIAQSELALDIERDIAAGGSVEEGPLYWDPRLRLARSKRGGKAVGE